MGPIPNLPRRVRRLSRVPGLGGIGPRLQYSDRRGRCIVKRNARRRAPSPPRVWIREHGQRGVFAFVVPFERRPRTRVRLLAHCESKTTSSARSSEPCWSPQAEVGRILREGPPAFVTDWVETWYHSFIA